MMKAFMNDDFLLSTDVAQRLYHDYAKSLPIFDYHCHLSPKDIAENRQFNDLTEIWLEGDHYKWRAARTAGVPERFITGMRLIMKNISIGQRLFPCVLVIQFIIGYIWN